MTIREATLADLDILIPLFDGYRQFYRQPSNLDGARKFLTRLITQGKSIVYIAFLAYDTAQEQSDRLSSVEQPVGFTQLYPIFSSVSMEPMYILNDLFIDPRYRGKGMGTALINSVKKRCKAEHQKGIIIQTETTNPAQKLYERLGFKKDPDLHYFWATE